MLALPGASTASEFLRLTLPLLELKRRGWIVAMLHPEHYARVDAWSFKQFNILVVLHRNQWDLDWWRSSIELCHAQGKKVVYDAADDVLHPREWGGYEPAVETVREMLALCDAVTCATPYLGKKLREVNPEVYVIPNCVDLLTYSTKKVEGLTIGLSGGDSHHEDWKIVSEALHRIAQEREDVSFYIGGYLPYYLRDLPRLTYQEWVPFREFPKTLENVHIGLAPLNSEDDFNLGKSELKAVDYMASGAVAICSDHPVYRGVPCIRAKDDQWYEKIMEVLDTSRRPLIKKGLRWVRVNRDIRTQWRLWASAYRQIGRGREE